MRYRQAAQALVVRPSASEAQSMIAASLVLLSGEFEAVEELKTQKLKSCQNDVAATKLCRPCDKHDIAVRSKLWLDAKPLAGRKA